MMVDYEKMILKHHPVIETIDYYDYLINVFTEIPYDQHLEMLDAILAGAAEGTGYNPILLNYYTTFYITKYHTEIQFNDDEDVVLAADELLNTELFDMIIKAMGKERYEAILADVDALAKYRTEEHRTATYTMTNLIKEVASGIGQMKDMVNEFDPEKYQAVIDFATAANGGRPIKD